MNDFLSQDLLFDHATWTVIAGALIAVGVVGIMKTLIDYFAKEQEANDKDDFTL